MTIRILWFTLPIDGHLNPSVAVMRALVDRGVTVEVFATPAYDSRLLAAGVQTHHYPGSLPQRLTELSVNPAEVALMLAEVTAGELLEASRAAIQAVGPDVVVVDSMAPWGRLAARQCGVPVATSTSSFLIHAGLATAPGGVSGMARGAVASGRAVLRLGRIRRQMRSTHGIDPGGPLTLLSNRGDVTIVYTSRALQPGGDRFGDDVRFVGPTITDRADNAANDDASTDDASALLAAVGEGSIRYVSLGTVYNDRPEFLRSCIFALAGDGAAVVVATGTSIDPGDLGPLPDGVHLIRYAPQLALLRRASLFVTHAGMNSVSESLWCGVPMLAFPQAADQPVVAARIARLGAGRVLRGREPGEEQIRRQARKLLDGSPAQVAEQIGAGLRQGGGAAAAADAVLDLMDGRIGTRRA